MNRRKPLRLENFDYSLPGTYFITVCTKEKRCLLGSVVGADDHIGPYNVFRKGDCARGVEGTAP